MKFLLFHSRVPGVRVMNELILCLVSGEQVTGRGGGDMKKLVGIMHFLRRAVGFLNVKQV